jgi:hypothetical protein
MSLLKTPLSKLTHDEIHDVLDEELKNLSYDKACFVRCAIIRHYMKVKK